MSVPKGLIVTLLVLFALPTFAADNRWSIQGPDGSSVNRLVFDPASSSIAYAGTTNGIFRSADGGQHWTGASELLGTPINDVAVAAGDPQKVFVATSYGLYKSNDRGLTWAVVHGFGSYAVAVSRTNANIVYSDSTGGPFRSSDGGATFGSVGSGLPSAAAAVSVLAVDPQSPDTVYAAYQTNVGVYKSVDGGAHWTPANTGLPQAIVFSMVIDPSNGSTLYAGSAPGLFKSTDGGGSWTALTNGLPSSPFCYSLSISAGTIVAGIGGGLYKSMDGGATWTSAGFNGNTVNPAAIDPANPANILASANSVTFKSTNGGANFAVTSGLTAFYTLAIAVDPQNASVVYAGGSTGVFKSVDRGVSWTSLLTNQTGSIAVDSQNSQTVYANPFGTVRRSTDGGVTWSDFTAGLPAGSALVVAADPQVSGTIYTILGNAVYKKIGSASWVKASTGIPNGSLTFITIDRNNSSTLYAGGGIGIYKSIDGGTTWTATGRPAGGVTPTTVIIDPFDSGHLFSWSGSSAFESTDGGANWSSIVVAGGRQAITLAFDPSAPGRIYSSGADNNGVGTIDRSNDGGKTWFSLRTGLGRGLNTIFVVAPGGNMLYAGSTNGGVWAFHFARARAAGK
ncbi:MAG TPA: hypothetical protein VNN25_22435 [Thermoanaerobaculia bacterium]|nr:hypothetical protein [Thermoanaerobaculia bacterium]